MTYPIPGDPEEFEQRLDNEELEQLSQSDRQLLEQANKTITNLLRKEPLTYFEVAQNALVQTLEQEKIALDGRCRELLDQIAGARAALREAGIKAQQGDVFDTMLLLKQVAKILGED